MVNIFNEPLFQFTILMTVAFAGKALFSWLKLPGDIGPLILGMILGPGGVALISAEELVEVLGRIGLIYVMFIAGLEINLRKFSHNRKETLYFGFTIFLTSLIPTITISVAIGFPFITSLLLAAAVSSHTLLAYPAAKRAGLINKREVVIAIGGTLITDTLALVLFAIVMQYSDSADPQFLPSLIPVLYLFVLTVLSLLIIPKASKFVIDNKKISRIEKGLFVLMVMLLLAMAAEIAGTEHILGAFLAGICLNTQLSKDISLGRNIEFLGRMMFFPLFFIWVGVMLNLEVFITDIWVWALALVLTILVIVGKVSAVWILSLKEKLSRPKQMVMAGLTIPQAAATLAIAVTAYEAGIFTDTILDAMIIVVFFTSIIGPVVVSSAAGRY
ncbi:Na+/H+ antiporter [Chitinispirillum alkaliphilum]|nr:Na+/H+ antiporter [Chitinispirillum alkaliphilum]